MKLNIVFVILFSILLASVQLKKSERKNKKISAYKAKGKHYRGPVSSEKTVQQVTAEAKEVAKELDAKEKLDQDLVTTYQVNVVYDTPPEVDAPSNRVFKGYIHTNNIKSPDGIYIKGLYFNTNGELHQDLSNVFLKEGTEYYIPYRLFGQWTNGNPIEKKRFISTTVTLDKVVHNLFLRFDDCISTNEQQKLVIYLTQNAEAVNSQIRHLKSASIEATTKYIENFNNSQTILQGTPATEAKIKNLEQEIQALESAIHVLTENDQPKLEKEIEAAQLELQKQKNLDSEISQQYKVKSNSKKQKEQLKSSIESNIDKTTEKKNEYDKLAGNYKKAFDTAVDNLRIIAEGDNSDNDIIGAVNGFNGMNLSQVEANLKNIKP